MRRAKAWLDTHGTDLHRYGAPAGSQALNGKRSAIPDDTDY